MEIGCLTDPAAIFTMALGPMLSEHFLSCENGLLVADIRIGFRQDLDRHVQKGIFGCGNPKTICRYCGDDSIVGTDSLYERIK